MFSDLRVVSLARDIRGAYCAKLLRDAGADVVLVEPPAGSPLRTWTASGADLRGEDGALFRFLHGGMRSAVGDADLWIAAADVVVCDELDGVDVDALRRDHPKLVVVTITPWGWVGPWRDRPATEFTVQAAAGSSGQRGVPDRPPIAVGARLAEWIAGTYAGAGAAAAAYGARRHGRGEHVDVAVLDCVAVTMTNFAPVFASFEGWPADPGPSRTAYIPGIEPTSDGWVGVTAMTWQQLQDFFCMVERPDWAEDRSLATRPGREARKDEIMKSVHEWTRRHTTEDVIEQATAYRIPTVAITRPDMVPNLEQLVTRGVFERHPGADFVQPRPPYRLDGRRVTEAAPAPRLGEGAVRPWTPRPAGTKTSPAAQPVLPLAGLKVADFTIFWAGPTCTQTLAALGADVVKIESFHRLDGARLTTRRPDDERWYEYSPLFHPNNQGKRSIGVDLNTDAGKEIARRLIAEADVVIENFTPRVMEHFGLDWEAVQALNPRAVMVRMPGFGLDGPWRDRPGFATTMEQLTGMCWTTGFPDGPPVNPGGVGDPIGGTHAALAIMVALAQRDDTGRGVHVEAALVEPAVNVAIEAVLEASAYGVVLERIGNRGRTAAPQNTYRCAGDDEWCSLAVEDDAQWSALVDALGRPDWARSSALRSEDGRRAAHDELDARLAEWFAPQDAAAAAETLVAAGVPAARAIPARELVENPHALARGLYRKVDHPLCGEQWLPTVAIRFADHPYPWALSASPTLGQHGDEVLAELGYDPAAIAALKEADVISERAVS